jgi:hypothetical protein
VASALSFVRIHGQHRRTERPCPLCLAAAQPFSPMPRDTRFPPLIDALIPWLLAFGFVVPLAAAVEGDARNFSAGIACGILIGAAFAWQLHRRDRETGIAAAARVRAQITAESEARANTVIKQFEWAINDIDTLRAKLSKAEQEVREHTQHAFVAEREMRRLERNARLRDRRFAVKLVDHAGREPIAPAPTVLDIVAAPTVDLRCELNDSGPLAWLELSSDDPDNLPSRVRVFERGGSVICVSDPAVHSTAHDGEVHHASLRLPLPPELAGAARRGALDEYHFEALVAHRWVGVRFHCNRAGAYRETRGRAYRRG